MLMLLLMLAFYGDVDAVVADAVDADVYAFGLDQVGFHRYVDSRHFMSSCRRLLGLQHVYSQEVAVALPTPASAVRDVAFQ